MPHSNTRHNLVGFSLFVYFPYCAYNWQCWKNKTTFAISLSLFLIQIHTFCTKWYCFESKWMFRMRSGKFVTCISNQNILIWLVVCQIFKKIHFRYLTLELDFRWLLLRFSLNHFLCKSMAYSIDRQKKTHLNTKSKDEKINTESILMKRKI